MRNRFASKKREFSRLREILLPVLLFALIAGFFLYSLGSIGATTDEERLRSVQQAVIKSTVQCYAIEGQYPPSLKYLEEHYGLILDHERYIIQYDAFASNIMPTIIVLPVGFGDTPKQEESGGLFDGF